MSILEPVLQQQLVRDLEHARMVEIPDSEDEDALVSPRSSGDYPGLQQIMRSRIHCEEDRLVLPSEFITVNVALLSGKAQQVRIPLSENVSKLRQLAKVQFQEDVPRDLYEVSVLLAVDGTVLSDSARIEDTGLFDGSDVTAVVTEIDELKVVEGKFHDVILGEVGCREQPWLLTRQGFTFPSLESQIEEHGNGATMFYSVPGMFGGFFATLSKNDNAEYGYKWELLCRASSRMDPYSERQYCVTKLGAQKETVRIR